MVTVPARVPTRLVLLARKLESLTQGRLRRISSVVAADDGASAVYRLQLRLALIASPFRIISPSQSTPAYSEIRRDIQLERRNLEGEVDESVDGGRQ